MDSREPSPKPLFVLVILVLLYPLAHVASSILTLPDSHIPLIWLGSGCVLCALTQLPYRWWPAALALCGIMDAAITHLISDSQPVNAVLVAMGDMIEPLTGAAILRFTVGSKVDLSRARDALWLSAALVTGATFSGLVVVPGMVDAAIPGHFALLWQQWTFSAVLGSTLLSWTVLSWLSPRESERLFSTRRAVIGFVLLALLAVLQMQWVLATPGSTWFLGVAKTPLLMPVLLWTAIRWGPRATSLLLTAITIQLLVAFEDMQMPGDQPAIKPAQIATALQLAIAIAGGCLLVISSISWERRKLLARYRTTIGELTLTKGRLEKVLDSAPMATMLVNTDRIVMFWNKAAERIFGWRAEEVVGRPVPTVPEHLREAQDIIRNRILAGETLEYQDLVRQTKDGRLINITSSAGPAYDADGKINTIIVMQMDATRQHQADESLKQERDFNATILNTVGSLVVVLDAQGRIVLFNRACEKCVNYTYEEVKGRRFWDFLLSPEEKPGVMGVWDTLVSGNADLTPSDEYTNHWITKDGRPRLIMWTTAVLRNSAGEIIYVIGTGTDLTDSQRAERSLRAVVEGTSRDTGEDFFRNLVRHLAQSLGASWASLAVIDPGDATARTLALWHGDIIPNIQYALRGTPCGTVIDRDQCHYPDNIAAEFPDDLWLRENHISSYMGMRIADSTGKAIGILALMDERPMHDTSQADALLPIFAERAAAEIERMRAQELTIQLRTLLQDMIDSMPSTLAGVDNHSIVTHWNREAEILTTIPARDALGRRLEDVLPVVAPLQPSIAHAISFLQTQAHSRVPWTVRGEQRFFDITIYPLIADWVGGAVVRLDDVTDRTRMEEMVIQSEKMVSIGGLAAGLAHEVNNPLAGMMQGAQVIQNRLSEHLPANQKAADAIGVNLQSVRAYAEHRGILAMLESMRDTGQRAAKIVNNMLHFSRKNGEASRPTSAADLIEKTLAITRNDYDLRNKYDFHTISIVCDIQPDMPLIPCQETEIQQVLLNLLKNAAEAMFEQPDASKPPTLTLRVSVDDDKARIEVRDNGPGMTDAVRRRVFEPFFTTKGPTTGTGLGLPVCYFIVTRNHGGTMTVESTPGVGTSFILHLPLSPIAIQA